MSFWDSNTGQWIIESVGTILVFLLFWKIFGKKIMHKNDERQRKYWKTKLEAESKYEQKEAETIRATTKPLTQQSFEEWKAEKRKRDQGGFVDLDAPIILPWRKTT